MPAQLTPEERALIDAAVKAGAVQKIPPGGTSTATYVWQVGPTGGGQLVAADPDKRGGNVAHRRKVAALNAARGVTKDVEARRAKVLSLKADGHSAQAIADQLGTSVQTIYADAKALGVAWVRERAQSAPTSRHDADRIAELREKVRLAYDGVRESHQIADLTGISRRSVDDHLKALGLPKIKAPKRGGPRQEWLSTTRAKREERQSAVKRLVAEGKNGPEIMRAIGIKYSTLGADLRELGLKLPRKAHRSGDMAAMTKTDRAERDRNAVKDRRRFKTTPIATGTIDRLAPESATGTVFPSRIEAPGPGRRVLIDGASISKIGGDVLVGHLKGARIVTLTLEERATCPTTCALWQGCYGNNMQHSTRWKHGPELMARIEADLDDLFKEHDRVLVRLHVLGDFWSTAYVDFWGAMLDRHPGLYAFGFTAWPRKTWIGEAVADLRETHPGRFMIRHSGITGPWGAFTIDFPTERKTLGDALVCPEQRHAVDLPERQTHCGSCAACWSTDRPIVFVEH